MVQLRQKEKQTIVLAWVNEFLLFCLSFGGPKKGRFIIGPEKDLFINAKLILISPKVININHVCLRRSVGQLFHVRIVP